MDIHIHIYIERAYIYTHILYTHILYVCIYIYIYIEREYNILCLYIHTGRVRAVGSKGRESSSKSSSKATIFTTTENLVAKLLSSLLQRI